MITLGFAYHDIKVGLFHAFIYILVAVIVCTTHWISPVSAVLCMVVVYPPVMPLRSCTQKELAGYCPESVPVALEVVIAPRLKVPADPILTVPEFTVTCTIAVWARDLVARAIVAITTTRMTEII